MKRTINIRTDITFTPASRKSSQKIQELLMEDAWILVVNRSCKFAYLERFKGGDPDDYVSRTEELVGIYYSRDEAEDAKEKAIDSWRRWLLIQDGPAGEAYTCEYVGGYYSDYTGNHETVTGSYDTPQKAEQALLEARKAMHCWLVIDDPAAGTARLAEHFSGPYQQHGGSDFSVYKSEADALAAYEKLMAYYNSAS